MTVTDSPTSKELNRLRKRLGEVRRALQEFHAVYDEVAGDEILRFELMCDWMFSTFTYKDAPTAPADSVPVSNLDTGDAIPKAFPPFLEALHAEVTAVTKDAHHYYGPESIEALAKAAIHFIEREKFPRRPMIENLRVLPGTGTVHLYDACCRVHIEKEGDTVLLPELGYGFFITQPERVGGRVATVRCDSRGVVTGETLAAEIDEHNFSLWREWRQNVDVLFERNLQRLRVAGLGDFGSAHNQVVLQIKDILAGGPEMWRSPPLLELVESLKPDGRTAEWCSRMIRQVRPPRVVAFLHIQPTVTGHVYDVDELKAIAAALNHAKVIAFEDIAYHSIRCRLRELPSLQGLAEITHILLGLSKPFAIANMRLGLLYVDQAYYERIRRALESTTGYVSVFLQRVLAQALNDESYNDYIAELSWSDGGYETRYQLLRRMLTGDSGGDRDEKRLHKLVMKCATTSPELSDVAGDFLEHGLKRWFTPLVEPKAGFFQIVSCAPLLKIDLYQRLGVRSSFDVFALLAYLFDLRTIPEEAMRPGAAAGTRLRLAFSPDEEVMVRLFLRAFAGLTMIESEGLDVLSVGAQSGGDLGIE